MPAKIPGWKKEDAVYFECCNIIGTKKQTRVEAEETILESVPAGFKCPGCGKVTPEGEA